MSAEAIARVIRDFRRGSVALFDHDSAVVEGIQIVAEAQTIDVTTIYDSFHGEGKGWYLYEDSVLRPPLMDVSYCWVNRWGNVHVANTLSTRSEPGHIPSEYRWESHASTHTIDWDRVEWVTSFWLWIGGRSKTSEAPIRTCGPWALGTIAVYPDGEPADIQWGVCLKDESGQLVTEIESAAVVITKAITFLNMRNVEVLEPGRPRAERRRVARLGVDVHEIHVKPFGQWRRRTGSSDPIRLGSMPLHMVRGHVARYGPRWGRGLLFGKYEGEYWIPPHTAGRDVDGESRSDYVVEVES
jgi:hypothetical protein